MKKIVICAVVVAASVISIFKSTNIVNSDVSNLQLEDVEAIAQLGEYEYHYYVRVPGARWKGEATGEDGKCHPAIFQKWDCPDGLVLDSCTPSVEVMIFD